MNSMLDELEQLSCESHENSIYAASLAAIIANHEADKADSMAKSAKSLEMVNFKDMGCPVTLAEHKARTSENYKRFKSIAFDKRLNAEKSKARFQFLTMRRDTLKTRISALQSQMRLV